MGVFEPITHSEEIKQLLKDAQDTFDAASSRFESQKKTTTFRLEELGKVKVNAWSQGMDNFVTAFGAFNNVTMDKKLDTSMEFTGSDIEPDEMIANIQTASLTAGEVAKAGFAAVGTGALVGIASYGGAMMFGTATTGTAIATLSGVAKTNATLAWFGGGAKAAGGLGMAGGSLVLAGIVVVPILAVGGIIAGVKGKARLAEARKIKAEAEDAAEKLRTMTAGMSGIEVMAENYSKFIRRFGKKFQPFLTELKKIRERHADQIDAEGMIDFDVLTVVEQKTLHLSWLMAQVYYSILSTTILTDQGNVAGEAERMLASAKHNLKSIKKDTYKMAGDDAKAADIFWKDSARHMMIAGFITMAVLIAAGVLFVSANTVVGILFFADALIAMPVFFVFRQLPESRKYSWRLFRIILSVAVAVAILVLHKGGF